MTLTASTQRKWVPGIGHWATFQHRDTMKRRWTTRQFKLANIPATTLPVDGTNNAAVNCPMDGNDSLGDCMYAMACHMDNIWTYGQGKTGFTESVFDLTTLENCYKVLSGGDNGMDEPMLIGSPTTVGSWMAGLCKDPAAIIVDSLDFDVTNAALTQFLIDNFYGVELMWSVPDDFLNGFGTGTVWAKADTPDPNNGHGTPLADVGGPNTVANGTNVNGFYRLWTWGTWCWVSPAFVASVQPQAFVVFSPRQFNLKTGYDSKGRHITTQAALWHQAGGATIPQSVISQFPPIGPPTTGYVLNAHVGYSLSLSGLAAGTTVTSSNPSVVGASVQNGVLHLKANAVGTASLLGLPVSVSVKVWA